MTRTVVEPVIVTRTAPVEPAAARPKQAAKPKPVQVAEAEPVAPRVPHDRRPVPLAAFVPSAGELSRGLAAAAGIVLAFVALAGSVVLVAVRRELV